MMKKLSKLKLKAFTEMNDDEMKNVVGGYGYVPGKYEGNSGGYVPSGTCSFRHTNGFVDQNVPKSVLDYAMKAGYVSKWCCDSCSSASWL